MEKRGNDLGTKTFGRKLHPRKANLKSNRSMGRSSIGVSTTRHGASTSPVSVA